MMASVSVKILTTNIINGGWLANRDRHNVQLFSFSLSLTCLVSRVLLYVLVCNVCDVDVVMWLLGIYCMYYCRLVCPYWSVRLTDKYYVPHTTPHHTRIEFLQEGSGGAELLEPQLLPRFSVTAFIVSAVALAGLSPSLAWLTDCWAVAVPSYIL